MNRDQDIQIQLMYVAFCDILGFSNSIKNNFEEISRIYLDLKDEIHEIKKIIPDVRVSVYSDAIIVTGDDLANVTNSVKIIYWFCLLHDLIIRGGIAYGKHWTNIEDESVLILSEALVKAVEIEKSVQHPIIAVSDEIDIPLYTWSIHIESSWFNAPFLHYENINFVNPFNMLWFSTAKVRLQNLAKKFPKHSTKYLWLIELIESIDAKDILIPKEVFDHYIEIGYIKYKKGFVPNE